MGEALLKHAIAARPKTSPIHSLEIVSAGTSAVDGMPPSANSVSPLVRVGIDISSYRATSLTQSMLDECAAHFEEIEKQFSQLEEAYNKRMLTDGDSSQRERMVSKATAEIEEINDRLESSFTNFDAAVSDLRSNTSDIMAAFKSFEEMFAKANIEDML